MTAYFRWVSAYLPAARTHGTVKIDKKAMRVHQLAWSGRKKMSTAKAMTVMATASKATRSWSADQERHRQAQRPIATRTATNNAQLTPCGHASGKPARAWLGERPR